MDITNIPLIAAGTGLLGLIIAFALYMRVNSVKIDNDTVADITSEIQDGATTCIWIQQFRLVLYFDPWVVQKSFHHL